MQKEKKKLTTKQKQNKHRALQYAAIGGMFASVITPFIIIGAINFDDWFVGEGGWRIGLGATLGLAVAGIAIFLVTYKKEKESKVTDGWITMLVIWFAAAFIIKLFEEIYHEIFSIMMWTGLGLAAAFGLDLFSKAEKRKADAYKNARAKVQEESIEEQAKKEVAEEENENRPVE